MLKNHCEMSDSKKKKQKRMQVVFFKLYENVCVCVCMCVCERAYIFSCHSWQVQGVWHLTFRAD